MVTTRKRAEIQYTYIPRSDSENLSHTTSAPQTIETTDETNTQAFVDQPNNNHKYKIIIKK